MISAILAWFSAASIGVRILVVTAALFLANLGFSAGNNTQANNGLMEFNTNVNLRSTQVRPNLGAVNFRAWTISGNQNATFTVSRRIGTGFDEVQAGQWRTDSGTRRLGTQHVAAINWTISVRRLNHTNQHNTVDFMLWR